MTLHDIFLETARSVGRACREAFSGLCNTAHPASGIAHEGWGFWSSEHDTFKRPVTSADIAFLEAEVARLEAQIAALTKRTISSLSFQKTDFAEFRDWLDRQDFVGVLPSRRIVTDKGAYVVTVEPLMLHGKPVRFDKGAA